MAFCVTNINVISVLDDDPGVSCLTASSNNISVVRGTTFQMIFDLQYQTTAQNGAQTTVPADLDGYSIDMSIVESSSSTSELLFASVQNRMINIDYNTARVIITVPVKYTSRLSLGNKYYYIRLLASNGATQKIIQGIASVSDS